MKSTEKVTAKTPAQSEVIMTELVLPNDTNLYDNLMGGRLMYWMDIAGAVCATKHSNCSTVTASVDNISFKEPIKKGDIVNLRARITRAFHTSMEIHIEVWGQNAVKNTNYASNQAYFTFVALDSNGKPTQVPEVKPENDSEQKLYDGALRRRQVRLILGGKMKPDDAKELKAFFNQTDKS